MQFDHYNISAPQNLLEIEKNFLCSIFELEVGPRPNFSRPGFWLYYGDKAIVHLIEQNIVAQEGPRYFDHIAFNLIGLESFIEKLENQNVKYTQKYVPDTKRTQIFFTSPCGVMLEVKFQEEEQL